MKDIQRYFLMTAASPRHPDWNRIASSINAHMSLAISPHAAQISTISQQARAQGSHLQQSVESAQAQYLSEAGCTLAPGLPVSINFGRIRKNRHFHKLAVRVQLRVECIHLSFSASSVLSPWTKLAEGILRPPEDLPPRGCDHNETHTSRKKLLCNARRRFATTYQKNLRHLNELIHTVARDIAMICIQWWQYACKH